MKGADPARGVSDRRLVTVAIYIALVFFVASESAMRVMVAPYLAEQRGLGAGVIGLIVAMFAAGALVTRLPAGAGFSPGRIRTMVLTGSGITATGYLTLASLTHPMLFGMAIFLTGVGWSIATTTLLAALVVARPSGAASTAAAMGWYSGFTGLGHAIAGVVGGSMADAIGFTRTFYVLAFGPIVGATAITLAIRRGRGDASRAVDETVDKRVSLRSVRSLPPAVWGGALVMVYINVMQTVTDTFQPLLVLAAGLSLTQVGMLSSVKSFSSSVVRLGSGVLFSKAKAAGVTSPLVVASVFAVVAIPTFAGSFWWQAALFVVIGLARGLLRVTGAADAFDAIEDRSEDTGMAAAVVQGGLDVGKLVGPVLAGGTAEWLGLDRMFQVMPVAIAIFYFWIRSSSRRRSTS